MSLVGSGVVSLGRPPVTDMKNNYKLKIYKHIQLWCKDTIVFTLYKGITDGKCR